MANTVIVKEHYIDLEMERKHNPDISFRMLIEEKTDIVKKSTLFTVALQYLNTGESVSHHTYEAVVKINGNTLVDEKFYEQNFLNTANYKTLQQESVTIAHDANGNASASAYVEIKTDELLLLPVYQTKGSASFSGALTKIDMSVPFVTEISVSANRYGFEAGANFTVGHSSYNLTSVAFTLKGLTREQANGRSGKTTQADKSDYVQAADGTYSLTLTKTKNLTSLNEIFFDLDSTSASADYALDSGKTYSYTLVLIAESSASFTFNGSFYVPQKVTSVSCESLIDLKKGDTQQLEYQVVPYNSEEQSVTFLSSNNSVATVDERGRVTAENDGVCFVTVKTVDGEFTATCTVNVFDKDMFPNLTNVEFLSENVVNKIRSAILFLFNRLTEKGLSVPTLPAILYDGKTHPVKQIRSILETIEECCQILKTASNSQYPCSSLPENQSFSKYNTDKQWFLLVNEWINFLNELNKKTN